MNKQSASQSQNDSVVSKPLSYSAGQSGSYSVTRTASLSVSKSVCQQANYVSWTELRMQLGHRRVPKADISSGNLSSTRSGEGLTREMSALKLASVANLQYRQTDRNRLKWYGGCTHDYLH